MKKAGDDISEDRPPSTSFPGPIFDKVLEGCQVISPHYRYLYVNEAVARHGRRTVDELLGRTMMDVYPGIEKTEMFAVLRKGLDID